MKRVSDWCNILSGQQGAIDDTYLQRYCASLWAPLIFAFSFRNENTWNIKSWWRNASNSDYHAECLGEARSCGLHSTRRPRMWKNWGVENSFQGSTDWNGSVVLLQVSFTWPRKFDQAGKRFWNTVGSNFCVMTTLLSKCGSNAGRQIEVATCRCSHKVMNFTKGHTFCVIPNIMLDAQTQHFLLVDMNKH